MMLSMQHRLKRSCLPEIPHRYRPVYFDFRAVHIVDVLEILAGKNRMLGLMRSGSVKRDAAVQLCERPLRVAVTSVLEREP